MSTLMATVQDRAWIAPANGDEVDRTIDTLITDVSIIQAQLTETRNAWCERTGLGFEDYAAWRRRALFAKAYKEAQLRHCKRMRHDFADERSHGRADPHALRACARSVIDAWDDRKREGGWIAIDVAIDALRRHLSDDSAAAAAAGMGS